MFHTAIPQANWPNAPRTSGLPRPLDSEALSLLRLFLTPILERAASWQALHEQLCAKGFRLVFRRGHMVILNDTGEGLCTGSDLGVPLAALSARIGRPCVRAHRTGQTGELDLPRAAARAARA
ncbi:MULTISPECIES: hypothetical protein [Mameliella]|uniref:Uncharacterized protein n=1 Tax=Mameliella alba TaxID=561184 RepID=A0A0B3S8S9_9RHOB|nr:MULTISPECIES: hypothetical protein [Mameliella]KHQ53076.1 hypothetical protein OA50_02101 [Mameliella alba]MDD9730217.1 hypothetical protein [Mameliella sp. AT18]ODM46989.1 hypothetical protein A9320_06175 [Ruegeria sp. PBVC088]